MIRHLFSVILAVTLSMASTSCLAQARAFKSLADMPDVNTVFIGEAAMRMANVSGLSKGKFSPDDKVKTVEIVTCESPASIQKAKAIADSMIEQMHLELLLETKDDGEITRIYCLFDKDNKDKASVIMIQNIDDDDEMNIVYLTGKITLSNITNDKIKQYF